MKSVQRRPLSWRKRSSTNSRKWMASYLKPEVETTLSKISMFRRTGQYNSMGSISATASAPANSSNSISISTMFSSVTWEIVASLKSTNSDCFEIISKGKITVTNLIMNWLKFFWFFAWVRVNQKFWVLSRRFYSPRNLLDCRYRRMKQWKVWTCCALQLLKYLKID